MVQEADMQKKPRIKIERHLPPVGTTLKANYKKKEYKAKIVEKLDFPEHRAVSFDNAFYKTMTAAAVALTKHSINGWDFWKIEG